MKKIILGVTMLLMSITVSAQFVAKMEVKEPIEGVCDNNEVYALIGSFDDQIEATCPVTKEEILKRLNTEIQFIKNNPKFKGKGMIGIIVNCKGEVVQCQMDNKTKSPELDKQIEAVFSTLGDWKPGKFNQRKIDSSMLFSFKIKKGKFSF